MMKPSRCKSTKIQRNEYSNNKEQTNVIIEDQLATEIHKENLGRLAEMSEEEILKEKKNLEETLDPSIIQFLRNKNKKSGKRSFNQDCIIQHDILSTNETRTNTNVSNDENINSSNDNDEIKMDCELVPADIPTSSKELLEESKQKGWLHMNIPEPAKLKWMDDLPAEKNKPPSDEWYNARFDFNGE